MTLVEILLLAVAGIIAGIINTLAGSGSLITLPLLMFMGLPPTVANGTNRLGVVFQNLIATFNFKRQGELKLTAEWPLMTATILGSLLGASLAVQVKEDLLNWFIGSLLLIMFILLLFKPALWVKEKASHPGNSRPNLVNILIFFAIGIYGGFIQAGVGLFLLAGLVLGAGYDLVKANALKVLMILLFTVGALVIFIQAKQVIWSYGLVLAASNSLGAWFASRNASRIGAKRIRYLLLVVVLFSGIKILWQPIFG